jgi:hypothetical protein
VLKIRLILLFQKIKVFFPLSEIFHFKTPSLLHSPSAKESGEIDCKNYLVGACMAPTFYKDEERRWSKISVVEIRTVRAPENSVFI